MLPSGKVFDVLMVWGDRSSIGDSQDNLSKDLF